MEGAENLQSSGQTGKATEEQKTLDTNKENQTLYVGNLKPGVSNQKLYDFFTDHKFSVVHANVKVSSKDFSNVFGIVMFCSEAEAQKALDLLNNSELEGCKIRLMWWNPSAASKDKESANIFVKDLDQSVTQKDLSDKFSVFGNILSVKLETFPDGSSKGYGYVQYEEAEESQKAIDSMDGTEWKGKTISVTEFKKKDQRESTKTSKNYLYIRNFPDSYDEDNLRDLFKPFGTITSVIVKTHGGNKKQAFLCYENEEQAQKAIDNLNGTKLEGCTTDLMVTELQSKQERKSQNQNQVSSLANNLYVNGIPKTSTEEEIRKEFEKYGPVSSIKMNMKPSRDDKSKIEFIGAAFVCYENAEDAKDAVYAGDMETFFGKKIYVDYYKPKQFKQKEKQEEIGVGMKQMIHQFMMTALSQQQNTWDNKDNYRGGYNRGRGSRGGYSRGGYSGHSRGAMPAPYSGHAPNYGYRPQPPHATSSQGTSYSANLQSNPPLPGSNVGQGHVSAHPPPPMVGTPYTVMTAIPPQLSKGAPISQPPVASQSPAVAQKSSDDVVIAQTELKDMSDEEMKNYIGEKIYPLIEEWYGEKAPRITGMIIEMDPSDLIPALNSTTSLKGLAEEGYELLKESQDE